VTGEIQLIDAVFDWKTAQDHFTVSKQKLFVQMRRAVCQQ